MVIGVVPVIPKRKEEFAIEVKMDESDEKETAAEKVAVVKLGD